MSDEKSNHGAQDRSQINASEDYELKYWANKWSMSVEDLRQVVDQVGPMTKDVAKKLGKTV